MTDKSAVQSVVAAIIADFGRLDVLINNAGLMPIRPMAEVNTDEWDQMIDVNLKGTLYGIAAALPGFLEQGSGHIINLSSVAGIKVFAISSVSAYVWFALLGAVVTAVVVQLLALLAPVRAQPVTMALAGAAVMATSTSLVGAILVSDQGALDVSDYDTSDAWQIIDITASGLLYAAITGTGNSLTKLTATIGGTPMKMSSGVMRKPPPTPTAMRSPSTSSW